MTARSCSRCGQLHCRCSAGPVFWGECDCLREGYRCKDAEGMWAAANAIYYSQGYDAWLKALEPYNEHMHHVRIFGLLEKGAGELSNELRRDIEARS